MNAHKEDLGMVKKWIRPIGLGALVGAIGCVVLLLLFSALLLTQDVPQTLVSPLSLVAAGAGGLIGGFAAARIAGQNGWLMGAAAGALLFLVLLVAGGFTMVDDMSGSRMLLKLGLTIGLAAVGGVLAVNLRRR